MSPSMSSTASPPPRCQLPGPAIGNEIAVVASEYPSIANLADLTAEVYPDAKDLTNALEVRGFKCAHIGVARVSTANLIHDDGTRFWIFGPKLSLSNFGRSVEASLREEGLKLPAAGLRVVWGMPVRWHPQNTMERVSAQVFRGCLAEDLRLLGIPFGAIGTRWAYWVGVQVDGLDGPPRIAPAQFP